MLKTLLPVLVLILTLSACTSNPVTDTLSPDELLIGTWKVNTTLIDGQSTPVTNPGLGQIQVIFTEAEYTYTFPEISSTGLANGNTQSVSGSWALNDDSTVLTLTPNSDNYPVLEWEVLSLTTGVLNTRFEQVNPASPGTTITYEITYILD